MPRRFLPACLIAAALTWDAAAGVFAQTGDTTLPPARAGLRPVPLPALDGLEAAVTDQLRSAERGVEESARGQTKVLATAYGSLAQLFHAYELFESAEPAYVNAALLAPADAQWPHLLGYLYQQTGQPDRAIEQFARALQLQPARREAAARLADAYLQTNRLREALEQFRALRDVFPAFARNGLGEVALRERRFGDALEHFSEALSRMPDATALHYSMAMAYRGLGQLDRARAELARRGPSEIRLGDPAVDGLGDLVRGERLMIIRGMRALDAGAVHEAASWFERALAAAPQSIAARTNLATSFVRLGDIDRAIEQLDALTRIAPDDNAIVTLAILLSDRSRFGEAVARLTEAYARSPQSVEVATTLARLLAAAPDLRVRDPARALDIAMRVYQSSGTAAHAETVAIALGALDRCGDALEWMRRAVAAADRSADAADAVRLTGELQKYQAGRCTPGGR